MSRDEWSERASLLVEVSDAWAAPQAFQGEVAVELTSAARRREPSFRTAAGHFAFMDLPAAAYDVDVRPDARTGYYFGARQAAVAVPRPNVKNPVVTIALAPAPNYPFAPATTLVRGTLHRAGVPVEGALVEVMARPERTTTNARGDFALCFGPQVASGAIAVRLSHASFPPQAPIPVALARGVSTSMGLITV
jgi:hypothetical protein